MRGIKKPFLSIVLVIVVLVLTWPYALKASYSLEAPKFSALHYTRTDKTYGCWAIITDDVCNTNYYYAATGQEATLAQAVIADLEKAGWKLTRTEDGYLAINCRGDADFYSFSRYSTGKRYPASMDVTFVLPHGVELQQNSQKIGCENRRASFEVVVSRTAAQ